MLVRERIATILKRLDTVDLTSNLALDKLAEDIKSLPLDNLQDQHPANARLIIIGGIENILKNPEAGTNINFEWCKDFFKRAMTNTQR